MVIKFTTDTKTRPAAKHEKMVVDAFSVNDCPSDSSRLGYSSPLMAQVNMMQLRNTLKDESLLSLRVALKIAQRPYTLAPETLKHESLEHWGNRSSSLAGATIATSASPTSPSRAGGLAPGSETERGPVKWAVVRAPSRPPKHV